MLISQVQSDLEMPNLFIGKVIGDKAMLAEVISFDEKNIEMKITHIGWEPFSRYVSVGITYPLFRHEGWNGNLLLWEFKPEKMKRSVSQLLLQWEKSAGWCFDLDI